MPINLEVPKKFGGARQPGAPGRRERVPPELAQVRPRRARVPEGARHARRGDRRHERERRARRRGRRHGRPARSATAPRQKSAEDDSTRNGSNMASLLGVIELCWGDVGLLLTMPRQGLGQAAIAAVANEEQLERFGGKWAAMAITEPEAGSDSAAIRTTAQLDGDEYVLNGEKIFVTSGDRAELIVVWATLDRNAGRGAIKSFVVERDNPGLKLDRLEHKLGIRASDTANFVLTDCRVPKENLLGSPEIQTAKQGFAGVMQTFDNTRPLVAGMALGVARACLERTRELLARGRGRDRLRRAAAPPDRRRRRVPRDGGRLRGRPPAHAPGGLDGRQQQAELAPGVDGQGQGRPRRHRHRPALRRAGGRRRLRRGRTAREVGPRRRRSSTSSRAPSRSSCSSSRACCSARARPSW